MKHVHGNLRPVAALSRTKVRMLPNARIQCASGRIRVGDRTYLSASDALSAYLQQFDGKQVAPPAQHAVVPLSSAHHVPSSSVPQVPLSYKDGMIPSVSANQYSNDVSLSASTVTHNNVSASVTGLLTGSPRGCELPGLTQSSSRGLEATRTTLNSSPRAYDVPGMTLNGTSHFASQADISHVTSQAYSNSLPPPNMTSTSHGYSYSMLNTPSAHIGQSAANTTGLDSSIYGQTMSTHGLSPSTMNGVSPEKQYSIHPQKVSGANQETSAGQSEVVTPRARSEIETLLCTASVRREMALEAQDALREVKLKRLLEETKKRSENNEGKKSSLQQEVEEALSRSAQLLETIKTDALASPRCVSDVGSLSTDILLSVNPLNPADPIIGRQSRSRHRYSYRTSGHLHTRSVSVDRVPGSAEWKPTLQESGRRRSVDSLGPVLTSDVWREKGGQDVSSSAGSTISAMSEPSDILKHLQLQGSLSNGYGGGDRAQSGTVPHRTGPPSWIQELIPPTPVKENGKAAADCVTDSVFSQKNTTGGRAPPSWVNGMDQSDIASSVGTQELRDAAEVLAVTGIKTLVSNTAAEDSVLTDLSYAGPGLNYSDLVTSPAPKHKVSFSTQSKPPAFSSRVSDRPRNGSVLKNGTTGVLKNGNGKPPTGRIHQDLAGVDMVHPKPQNLSGSLSSSLGAADSSSRLRKKISEDSAEAKRTLDGYMSQLNGDADGAGRTEAMLAGIPRCSSLDTSNVMGQGVSVPSDVTGASPITKDSNFSSKLCLDDPTLTPAKQLGAAGHLAAISSSPDGDDLLDGDRSWENLAPSFKAPVHVGNSSPGKQGTTAGRPATPTLSGGQQPGSMEALKQMLFRLQTEEASGSPPDTLHMENGGASSLIPALADYNFEDEPGGQSLERALVHLGRLKTLVQTTGKKDSDQDSVTSSQQRNDSA